MSNLPSLARGGIHAEHGAEYLADQGELYDSLSQQTCPKQIPPSCRAYRGKDVGDAERKLLNRNHDRKNQKDRVPLVQPAPPDQDGEDEKDKIGRNPEVIPEK
jgi:hypothetical protein